jgi:hypothetical protein
MLFKARFRDGIIEGSITRTLRRWKRLQVVPGNRYRQPFGEVEVTSVEEVDEGSITAHDARLAGYDNRDHLLNELAGYPEGTLYRVSFRFAGADTRIALRENDDLSASDIEALRRRLSRLDNASSHGPWTRQHWSSSNAIRALSRRCWHARWVWIARRSSSTFAS